MSVCLLLSPSLPLSLTFLLPVSLPPRIVAFSEDIICWWRVQGIEIVVGRGWGPVGQRGLWTEVAGRVVFWTRTKRQAMTPQWTASSNVSLPFSLLFLS